MQAGQENENKNERQHGRFDRGISGFERLVAERERPVVASLALTLVLELERGVR